MRGPKGGFWHTRLCLSAPFTFLYRFRSCWRFLLDVEASICCVYQVLPSWIGWKSNWELLASFMHNIVDVDMSDCVCHPIDIIRRLERNMNSSIVDVLFVGDQELVSSRYLRDGNGCCETELNRLTWFKNGRGVGCARRCKGEKTQGVVCSPRYERVLGFLLPADKSEGSCLLSLCCIDEYYAGWTDGVAGKFYLFYISILLCSCCRFAPALRTIELLFFPYSVTLFRLSLAFTYILLPFFLIPIEISAR